MKVAKNNLIALKTVSYHPEKVAEIYKERNKFCLKYLEYSKLSKEEKDKIIKIFELNKDSEPGKVKVMQATFEELKSI